MQLQVAFSGISEHGIDYEITNLSWAPEGLSLLDGTVVAQWRLTKKSDNRVELRGRLRAGVVLECDRCLTRYRYDVDSPMLMVLEAAASDEHWRLHDVETGEAELERVLLDKPVADMAELLREQLLLALPEKMLCREDCLGLCANCGANLNEEQCGCGGLGDNSPFAVLAALKKKA